VAIANLAGLRQSLYDQADIQFDMSDETEAIVNRFLNRAQNQIALDAPYLANEGEFIIHTMDDVEPTISSDTIAPVAEAGGLGLQSPNPWVFKATLSIGATGAVEWKTDRTWDGRYIEITDGNGIKHTNRIRAVWEAGTTVFFSLWQPWNFLQWGEGPFATWRIYSNEYVLPDEVIEIKSARVLHEDAYTPIEILTQGDAEMRGIAEHITSVTNSESHPLQAFRRKHEQLPGPRVAPSAVASTPINGATRWQGPDPAGSFEYIVTYCIGKRHYDTANPGPGHWQSDADPFISDFDSATLMGQEHPFQSQARYAEPILESAPSPVSSTVTLTSTGAAGSTVTPNVNVTVPNIEYMLGFQMDGTAMISGVSTAFTRVHSFKSGMFVRIYRRRLTVDLGLGYTELGDDATPGGRRVTGLANLDFDDGFYLLAELKIDEDNLGVFVDDGSIIPDHSRRLRDIHGYQSLKFHPRPQEDFKIEIRAAKRPKELISDYDVPGIHPEATDLIVQKALVYLYERLKDRGAMMDAESQYSRLLGKHAKRYGLGVPSGRAIKRRAHRARRY
jgi:hypothetical protein